MRIKADRLHALALIGALSCSVMAARADATTPISGGLNLIANVNLGGDAATNSTHPSWAGNPSHLTGSLTSSVAVGGDSLTASIANASATWTGANAGSVNFVNEGWSFAVFNTPTSEADLDVGRGGDDWTYTFTASGDGKITLAYNESLASGNGFGLWGWGVDFSGSGSGAPTLNGSSPDQNGVFTGTLVKGQTYTIGLNGNPNIAFGGPPGDYSGYMNGVFDWKITYAAVPEPATWAMLILGAAMIGFAARRRRQGIAVPA